MNAAALLIVTMLAASCATTSTQGSGGHTANALHRCQEQLRTQWAEGATKEVTLSGPYAIRLLVYLPTGPSEAQTARVMQSLRAAYPGFEPPAYNFAQTGGPGWNEFGYLSLPAWRAIGERRFVGVCTEAARSSNGGAGVSAVLMKAKGEEADEGPVIHAYWSARENNGRP